MADPDPDSEKKADPDPGKKPGSETLLFTSWIRNHMEADPGSGSALQPMRINITIFPENNFFLSSKNLFYGLPTTGIGTYRLLIRFQI